MINKKDLTQFIEDAVDGLQKNIATNYRYMLDDRLAIFIGWSQGYGDEKLEDVIQSKNNYDWGINIGVKVWTSDDLWTDFDYLNYPYYENGDVLDNGLSISYNDNYNQIADWMLDIYNNLKDLKIDENGLILEA